jgi:hypothetical protein
MGMAAYPTGLADKPAGPRPGGLVQPRLRPARTAPAHGAVAGLPTAQRQLAGGEVHPESTSEAPG